jgi:hypothetical protein
MNLSEIVGFICHSEKENLISQFIFFPLSMDGKIPVVCVIPVEFECSFMPMLTKNFPVGLHIKDIFFRTLNGAPTGPS